MPFAAQQLRDHRAAAAHLRRFVGFPGASIGEDVTGNGTY